MNVFFGIKSITFAVDKYMTKVEKIAIQYRGLKKPINFLFYINFYRVLNFMKIRNRIKKKLIDRLKTQ